MQIQSGKIPEILHCAESVSYFEAGLPASWRRVPLRRPLRLRDGGTLIVFSRGLWNAGPGPEFRNAALSLNGRLLTGDVALLRCERDWYRSGRSSAPGYSHVILLAVRSPDPFPGKRKIPLYPLPPEEPLPEELPPQEALPPDSSVPEGARPGTRSRLGACAANFEKMSQEQIRFLFRSAGMERMHRRSERILHDMIHDGIPRAFLECLCESWGLRRNRKAFGALLDALWSNHSEEEVETSFEALLWGESGLLPFDSSVPLPGEAGVLVKQLWEAWWPLRKESGTPIPWHREGGRVWDTPERTLAGIALFLRRFGFHPFAGWLEALENAASDPSFCRNLLEDLILSDAFWDYHHSFRSPARKRAVVVAGPETARELAADVVVPSLRAYCLLTGNSRMAARMDPLFSALPGTPKTRRFVTALDRWFSEPEKIAPLLTDAPSRQGVLFIDSNFCLGRMGICSGCPFLSPELPQQIP